MEHKIFELRAPATLMVIMATRLSAENEAERYLLSRSGYGRTNNDFEKYILLQTIDGGGSTIATTDPYKHNIEELRIVHIYIKKYFDKLENGQVIDTEYIEGYVSKPKRSERIDVYNDLLKWELGE